MTELAAGTLQDISFAGVKWLNYTAYRGGFRPLDDLVKQHNVNRNDFFASAITGCSLDGKLYVLPFETNSGNVDIIYVNTDLLATRGVTPPTDAWTVNDFLDIAHKMTDPAHQQWGTDYSTGSYYDFGTLARTFGGDVLSSDTKKFTLTSDPNTVKAADWLASLRTNEDVAPLRGEAKGLGFANGNVALSGQCICSLPYTLKSVSNKFKFDLVLFPLGPTGMRGYEAFVTTFAMYAQTKHVAEAYDLLTFMTSPDTAKISPAYAHIAAWMGDGKNKGPFPMPYNFHPLLRRHGAQRVHLSPTHHHLHHRRPPRAAPPPGYPIPSEMAIAVASDPLDGPAVVLPEGDGQWAQSDAEHAVIASERSFMAWSVGEIMEAEQPLTMRKP